MKPEEKIITPEEKIINYFENKFLPNLLGFFSRKTTYFLTSLNRPEVNSSIEIILCFGDFSKTHLVSEILTKNKKTKSKMEAIKNIEEIEKEIRHLIDGNKKCSIVLDLLIRCIKKQKEDKECEKYKNISLDKDINDDEITIIDALGLYIYNRKINNKGKIVIFCDKIIDESRKQNVNLESLFEVVFVHELAHAYHHIGIDSKDNHNSNFNNFDKDICEGFANYMVDLYYTEMNYTNSGKADDLKSAFLNATSQVAEYGIYKDWITNDFSIMAITGANNRFRNISKSGKIPLSTYENVANDLKTKHNF